MTAKELTTLIRKGESQTLDFKKKITHVHKIAKTISSFANSRGGTVLIGVTDNHQVVGVDPEEERYLIEEARTKYCDPVVEVAFVLVEDDDGHVVLAVEVPESKSKPHFVQLSPTDWQVYVRMNDQSLLASKKTVKAMKQGTYRSKGHSETDFQFLGPEEKKLVAYLKAHQRITVKLYARVFKTSERNARRRLVKLAQAGLVQPFDLEKEVFYGLS